MNPFMLTTNAYRSLRCLARTSWLKCCYGGSFSHGQHLRFRKDFFLHVGGGGSVSIGDNVFFNNGCSITSYESVTIGDNCLFGENVKIYDHNHVFNLEDTPVGRSGFTIAPVTIGKNVWVCANVVICKGATIGDGSVIAAGAVVRGDVPADSMYMNDGACTGIKRRARV